MQCFRYTSVESFTLGQMLPLFLEVRFVPKAWCSIKKNFGPWIYCTFQLTFRTALIYIIQLTWVKDMIFRFLSFVSFYLLNRANLLWSHNAYLSYFNTPWKKALLLIAQITRAIGISRLRLIENILFFHRLY